MLKARIKRKYAIAMGKQISDTYCSFSPLFHGPQLET